MFLPAKYRDVLINDFINVAFGGDRTKIVIQEAIKFEDGAKVMERGFTHSMDGKPLVAGSDFYYSITESVQVSHYDNLKKLVEVADTMDQAQKYFSEYMLRHNTPDDLANFFTNIKQ